MWTSTESIFHITPTVENGHRFRKGNVDARNDRLEILLAQLSQMHFACALAFNIQHFSYHPPSIMRTKERQPWALFVAYGTEPCLHHRRIRDTDGDYSSHSFCTPRIKLHSTNQMNGSIEMIPGRKEEHYVPVQNSSDRSIMKRFSSRHRQIRSSHHQHPVDKPLRQVAGGRGEATERQALRGASHRLDHASAEGASGVLRPERARPLSPLATPLTL